MNQARRKTTRKKTPQRTSAGQSSGFAPPFIVGVAVGVLLTIFYFHLSGGSDVQFGSGLRTLFKDKEVPPIKLAKSDTSKTPKNRTVPKFDFYKMLPEYERVVLEDEPMEPLAVRKNKTDKGSFYILQAGSYARYADADRLKAKLAIKGLEPHIQTVSIEGKGKYYRVRLGPFINMRKLAEVDNKLSKQNIKAIRLKVTGTVQK
ncbi:SPOR domain-containing protein [Pseudomonadota bacterium]